MSGTSLTRCGWRTYYFCLNTIGCITSHTGRSRQQTDDKLILFVSRLEAVKVTIEKKKKCDARALEIVTNLSENTVVEECLLKSVSILAMYNLCIGLQYCILIHSNR